MEYHQCQNCEKNWTEDELKEIKHLEQRVLPGEIMPSGECPECGAVCHPLTEENCGNSHGYLCPTCKSGTSLAIEVLRWASLLPQGTEDQNGDTEWDGDSRAMCDCEWSGFVRELLNVEAENASEAVS